MAADLAALLAVSETDEEIARGIENAVAACEAEDWSDVYPPTRRA